MKDIVQTKGMVGLQCVENDSIVSYLMGDVSFNFLLAFYIFALIGIFLSMLLHYKRKITKKKSSFNLLFWVKDNVSRFFMSIISIFVVVRFYDELPIDYYIKK